MLGGDPPGGEGDQLRLGEELGWLYFLTARRRDSGTTTGSPLSQCHVLYVVSYLSMGLPAVVAGIRVVHGGGLLATTREYGVAAMVLAAAALLGTLARRPVR